jgi:hypothetical protein
MNGPDGSQTIAVVPYHVACVTLFHHRFSGAELSKWYVHASGESTLIYHNVLSNIQLLLQNSRQIWTIPQLRV